VNGEALLAQPVHHVKARESGSDYHSVKRFRVEHDLYATRNIRVREYMNRRSRAVGLRLRPAWRGAVS
jgi:hypothetical protein